MPPVDPRVVTVTFTAPTSDEPWFVAAYSAWRSAAERRGITIEEDTFEATPYVDDYQEDLTCAAARVGDRWYAVELRHGVVSARRVVVAGDRCGICDAEVVATATQVLVVRHAPFCPSYRPPLGRGPDPTSVV
ncbi:hypothetical protein [Amycolatopsis anabasis]|uniref:hypothetical protein n=1 Tax=Amycolatopsis anabasis TaxID=1840409 RepID=UPI00131E1536|nr:hypothetical protein [Amycolatopsis anabasis]